MDALQGAMTRLQLLLLALDFGEEQLESTIQQFRNQLQRIPTNTLNDRLPLDAALAIMDKVREPLEQAERTLHHLRIINDRAQQEIDALRLTQAIQQTQQELAALTSREEQDAATLQATQRLQALINDYSQQAARSITLRDIHST